MNLKFRKATEADISFIANAIIEAECSGSSYCVYEKVFGLNKLELQQIIIKALNEDIEGCELAYSSFTIAETNKTPIGCVASWIEGSGNRSSSNIKAFIFSSLLGIEKWISCEKKLKALSQIDIPRSQGALQFEAGYTIIEYRGNEILKKIIDHIIDTINFTDELKVQILSVIGNEKSSKVFLKSGFTIVQTKPLTNIKLKEFFPGNGRILWEKKKLKQYDTRRNYTKINCYF